MNNSHPNITCPKCGAEIPLTEAVSHRVREELTADFEQQRKRLQAAIEEREQKVARDRQALEEQARGVEARVQAELEAARRQLLAEAARQAEEKLALQLRDLQAQVDEKQQRLQTAQAAELELRRQQRELQESRDRLELDLARRLDAERQKILESARQQAADAERFKLAEKEQVIRGLQAQIEALNQRAGQGSVQVQGEALEAELQRELVTVFPHDQVVEVKKGQRGADVAQQVRTREGLDCGTILWEAKRARNWSDEWVVKLKEDQREAKADLAVLVITCPPEGVRGIGQVDGVWVCEPQFAASFAGALRQGLIQAAVQRVQSLGRADKMTQLYDYLCGVEFRQRIEGIVECMVALQEQLAAEQRAFQRQWREREQQIARLTVHAAGMYGSIQGIAGRQALPEIRHLQLGDGQASAQPISTH